jgi:hypothetical protein
VPVGRPGADPAAGSEDPLELGDGRVGVVEVLEDVVGDDEVHALAREREWVADADDVGLVHALVQLDGGVDVDADHAGHLPPKVLEIAAV